MWRRIALGARALFRRAKMDDEIDEELRYHFDREVARLAESGMSPESARDVTRRAFGNVARTQEAMRDSWGVRSLERLSHDVRFALRGFRRSPAFAATVILTIALGLGLNTTAFTLFDAYVLRPLSVRDPYSLYELEIVGRDPGAHSLSWSQYQQLSRDTSLLSESFAYRHFFARVNGAPVYGQFVTGNYFQMLGVSAALGRTFTAAESMEPGGAPWLVISHRAWSTKFGADSSIVGKVVRINGYPLTVIGVARPGFAGLNDMADAWVPAAMIGRADESADPFSQAQPASFAVIGRVRDDRSLEETSQRLAAWARAAESNSPERSRATAVRLEQRSTPIPISLDVMAAFAPIAAAFVLVMLIACANVANMMLARAVARQREIGIRLSLGASRGRLIGQFLTESILLALPAAAAGFAISRFALAGGVRLLFATIPSEFQHHLRVTSLTPDTRVFLFMLAAAVASAVVFGLLPALKATRPDLVQAARGDFDTEFRPSRVRNALVVAQISVCVLLLIVAGVMLSGTSQWRELDLGFGTEHVVVLDVREPFRARVMERLAARSDVRVVGGATYLPLHGIAARWIMPVSAEDRRDVVAASINFASPAFFSALDIPMLRGRNFSADEARDGAAVAIVTETAARRLWPDREAIGQALALRTDAPPSSASRLGRVRSARVVGVVRDMVGGFVGASRADPKVYYPLSADSAGQTLVLRVTGDAGAAARALDDDLTGAGMQPQDVHTMNAAFSVQLYPLRFGYWVACALGAIALVLTFTGIYGVLSYLVAQRRKEIGIRIALGAAPARVIGLVLEHSLRLAGIGLAIGAGVALFGARFAAAHLESMSPFEPLAYAAALAIVVVACLGAAYFPSLRATRVDPMESLRRD